MVSGIWMDSLARIFCRVPQYMNIVCFLHCLEKHRKLTHFLSGSCFDRTMSALLMMTLIVASHLGFVTSQDAWSFPQRVGTTVMEFDRTLIGRKYPSHQWLYPAGDYKACDMGSSLAGWPCGHAGKFTFSDQRQQSAWCKVTGISMYTS